MTSAIAVLSRDRQLGDEISTVCAGEQWRFVHARELAELDTYGTAAVVVDVDHPDAAAAMTRASEQLTIACSRTVAAPAVPGPRAVVARAALPATLRSIARGARPRSFDLERLLALVLAAGPLDHALAVAADEIATAFGAERCVISTRGDSRGAASGTQAWSSNAWSETADRCRVAAAADATLIGVSTLDPEHCESIMAVPLDTSTGGRGFIGVIARGPRIFTSDERRAISALGVRLVSELEQRVAHERSLEELDRIASAPGVDALLGIWNRAAVVQLAAMYVSTATRFARPLSAMIVDVARLHAINSQHGVEIGDRVLRRIADALRMTVRTEDVLGRWSGDKLALLLQGTELDGARRLADRIHTALAARHVDVRRAEPLAIPVKLGISQLEPYEDPSSFIDRAVVAARSAAEHGVAVASSPAGNTPIVAETVEEVRGLLAGTYRLVHEISRGGMGVVYRAEDLALERAVAIKMLRPDLAEDHALIEQLRREAALLARVQHPNLVQVYSFYQVGGDSYFVMELVEGESLRHALERCRSERGALDIADILTIVDEIAAALDTLHELGIVHRDVKPANIIRDPFRGRSVLVDVGIARRSGHHTTTAGTPGYVAPEVIRGEEASPRSDVYGLAATAYALLTLHEPSATGGRVPVGEHKPELGAVDHVLAKALATDPAQRPASARQLAAELRAALPACTAAGTGRRATITMILPRRGGGARTRGVVFRSLPRAFGARESGRLRDSLGTAHPELARLIGDASPLAWLPTDLLVELLATAPRHLGRDGNALARDIARATVRATFRRFFPASVATLAPERTLSAVRNIWCRYHSWGELEATPVGPGHHAVRITGTLRVPELCAFTQGMLEQLVVLSGAAAVWVDHETCEARGDRACLHQVSWELS